MSLGIDDRVALLIGRALIREQALEMRLAEALEALKKESETEGEDDENRSADGA